MSARLGRGLAGRALAPREFQFEQAGFHFAFKLQALLRLASCGRGRDSGQGVEVFLKRVLVRQQIRNLLFELLQFGGVFLGEQVHVLLVLLQDVTLSLFPLAGQVAELSFEGLEFVFALRGPLLLLLSLELGDPQVHLTLFQLLLHSSLLALEQFNLRRLLRQDI